MTVHGSDELPGIAVTSYSLTLKEGGGFVGVTPQECEDYLDAAGYNPV